LSVCCLLITGLLLSSAIVLSLIPVYLNSNTSAAKQGKIVNFSVIYSSISSTIVYFQISGSSQIESLSFNFPANELDGPLPVQEITPSALKYLQDDV
jgi:arginine utilization protein RocB